MKKCHNCKNSLDESCFGKNASRYDGLQGTCKQCRKIMQKTKYADTIKTYQENVYHYSINPKVKQQKKAYYERNKSQIIKQIHARTMKRRATDPNFKLISNIRSRVRMAVKRDNARKCLKTVELIGCSVAFLRNYIESKFKEGMSWDNYGEWHIDHIKPCAAFNFSDPIQQKECFHYSNLQPLWREENLQKSDKF